MPVNVFAAIYNDRPDVSQRKAENVMHNIRNIDVKNIPSPLKLKSTQSAPVSMSPSPRAQDDDEFYTTTDDMPECSGYLDRFYRKK